MAAEGDDTDLFVVLDLSSERIVTICWQGLGNLSRAAPSADGGVRNVDKMFRQAQTREMTFLLLPHRPHFPR